MAELMGNASQQRLEITKHTGGEVNAPGQQAGEGKLGFVSMKGPARFQEFLVFENDAVDLFTTLGQVMFQVGWARLVGGGRVR